RAAQEHQPHRASRDPPTPTHKLTALVLKKSGVELAVWTDVEFLTLGYGIRRRGTGKVPESADYHELDIVIVPAGIQGRPPHHSLLIGVECKNTGFAKHMARAAFGVRRELSYITSPRPTIFHSWPRTEVPANPASVFLVYSTDPAICNYNESGQVFGIDFIHKAMR
ncbi:hypothetical protein, partial [Nocardia gipuzkoensis]